MDWPYGLWLGMLTTDGLRVLSRDDSGVWAARVQDADTVGAVWIPHHDDAAPDLTDAATLGAIEAHVLAPRGLWVVPAVGARIYYYAANADRSGLYRNHRHEAVRDALDAIAAGGL